MKSQSVIRPLATGCFACMFAFSSTNCGSSTTEKTSSTSTINEAGAAGEEGAVTSGVSVCGNIAPASACDPLSAAPCNVADGETCDYDLGAGYFICLKYPVFSNAGGPCGADAPDCGPGTTCNSAISKCQHYCCSDSDCSKGSCLTDLFSDGDASAGVCADEFTDEK